MIETVVPEGSVNTHPVEHRFQGLRLGAVVGLAAGAPVAHQPSVLQDPQVLGHCGLRHAGPGSEGAHVLFAVAGEVLEDRATGGVGESSENVIGCDMCGLGLHGGKHNHRVMGCQVQIYEKV